jgi:hypothetical protein
MATSGSYFLNAPSLGSATAVFTDTDLSICAANGFYSDGVIVREQVDCVLLPQQTCAACSIPCGGTINSSGNQGVYYLSVNLGTDIGAVIIEFNPISVPDGISALFDNVVYNGLSSPTFGWLQGIAGLPTYIGSVDGDCNIVANSPYTLDEFEYSVNSFAPLGTTTNVSVVSGQMQLTASQPGNCIMVVPKTSASPSILDLTFIGPCLGTVFNISVSCPVSLTSFTSTVVNLDSETACGDTIDQTYYVAHVNGSGGVLGLYDLVFSDSNGEFKLNQGYYKTSTNFYQVDENGVVILIDSCPSTIFVAAVRLQGDGADCSSSSSDPFSAVAYIASDYADFVLNGAGRLVLDNTTGISFGGLETQLYDPNDANVEIVAESITNDLSGLILGDSIYNTIVNDESVLDTGSPKVTSSVSNIGTIQFSLCPS